MEHKFTFKNGDTVQLKNIKHSEFASDETHCFEATVYFNGKKIGAVSNNGQGASNRFEGDNIKSWGENLKVWNGLDERMKTEHPKFHITYNDTWGDTNMELWVFQQVTKFLQNKDFKRLIKSKIVFTDPDSDNPSEVRYFGFVGERKITPALIAYAENNHPNYQILNTMPEDKAFQIFVGA